MRNMNRIKLTDEEREKLETSCKRMLISTIAYDWIQGDSGYQMITKSPEYLDQYINKLGKVRVIQLADDLISRVDHVEQDTATDSEGLSYNSIVWKPGQRPEEDY